MINHTHDQNSWDQLAGRYEEKFNDLKLYDESYQVFCNAIKGSHPKLLEIACGPATITRYLASHLPHASIYAFDSSPEMIAIARPLLPQVYFRCMDCRDLDKLTLQFDAIICGFCLPYLSKPESAKLFRDTAGLLTPGGLFYCSFIEGQYENSALQTDSSGTHSMYVYYHEASEILQALELAGFDIQHKIVIDYDKSQGKTERHIIFISSLNKTSDPI